MALKIFLHVVFSSCSIISAHQNMVLQYVLVFMWGVQSMAIIWLIKYCKKRKWGQEIRQIYNSEQNVRNFEGQCKYLGKERKEQVFIEEAKIFQPETDLLLLTLLQLQSGQDQQHNNNTLQNKYVPTISFIIFRDFLMF